MTRPAYPYHLRSWQTAGASACGNFGGVTLPFKRMGDVRCKNCLKIMERNTETAYYRPRKENERARS